MWGLGFLSTGIVLDPTLMSAAARRRPAEGKNCALGVKNVLSCFYLVFKRVMAWSTKPFTAGSWSTLKYAVADPIEPLLQKALMSVPFLKKPICNSAFDVYIISV